MDGLLARADHLCHRSFFLHKMLSRMGGGVEALQMKRRQADLVLFRISSQVSLG